MDYGDSDGSISRVDIYAGTDLLVSDSTPPYAHSWIPPAAGTYALTARVFDNGKDKTSLPVTVTYQSPGCTDVAGNGTLDADAAPLCCRIHWYGIPGCST